jgi:hypothetical protein
LGGFFAGQALGTFGASPRRGDDRLSRRNTLEPADPLADVSNDRNPH